MTNRKSLQEVAFLMVLSSQAVGIEKNPKFKYLMTTPPFMLNYKLQKRFEKSDAEEWKRVVKRMKMSVNVILPTGFLMWAPEMRFWFAAQVCLRFVASGWRPPRDEQIMAFVQALYDAATTFKPGDRTPGPVAMETLARMPELVNKKLDLFLPALQKV